jgi:hypothetical protein
MPWSKSNVGGPSELPSRIRQRREENMLRTAKESLTLRKIASHIEQPETMWFATNPKLYF